MILFWIKTRESFAPSVLRDSRKPATLCVDHPRLRASRRRREACARPRARRRPVHAACPQPSAGSPLRAPARRSQAAAPHPHSQAPLCPASVFASRTSPLNGWSGGCFPARYLYQPRRTHRVLRVGPPWTASRSALRAIRAPGWCERCTRIARSAVRTCCVFIPLSTRALQIMLYARQRVVSPGPAGRRAGGARQTYGRDEPADFPADRRRRTGRGQHKAGSG